MRVSEGGHNIPTAIIIRRYYAGRKNLTNVYKDKVHLWLLIDNSKTEPEVIAEGQDNERSQIRNSKKWAIIENIVSNDVR